MTIDVHYHQLVREFLSEQHWETVMRFVAEDMGKITGKILTVEQVDKEIAPTWWDPTGDGTLARMNEAGVERAVLLAEDTGLLYGEPAIPIEEQHRQIGAIARAHPDRFIFCPNIDPRRPNALELFETCFRDWGAQVFKFYPPTGFNPDDRMCDPFLERLEAWGKPLIVHTGAAFGYSECAHPARLERIVRDFPRLTVLACHLSTIYWRDLLDLGRDHRNLVTDISGFQPTAVGTYGRFCYLLRRFVDEWGADRILWGTDSPEFDHILSMKDWAQLIRDLPEKGPEELHFTKEEVEAILHDNAARMLGIRG